MKHENFFMVSREDVDHDLFDEKPFCRYGFFAYLCQIAIYKPQPRGFGGKDIWLEKGDVAISLRNIKAATGWGKDKVRRFLRRLQERGIIRAKTATPVTIISINYLAASSDRDIYDRDNDHTPSETGTSHPPRQQRDSNETATRQQPKKVKKVRREEGIKKEEENNKNLKDKNICDSGSAESPGSLQKISDLSKKANEVFEHWKTVMNKSGCVFKGKRRRAVDGRLKDGRSVEDLKKAIDGCAQNQFNMGINKRGKKYNELELICRDDTQVQSFIDDYDNPPVPNSGGMTAAQQVADGLATAARIMQHQRLMEQHENMITDQNNNNKIGETYDNSEGTTE